MKGANKQALGTDSQPSPRSTWDYPPLTIGWKEYVDFPDWNLRHIKVKIDTGARTSALGVLDYELQQADNGSLLVHFRLAPYRKHPERITAVTVPVVKMVIVTTSSGIREERPVIEGEFRLGPITKRVLLTVSNRTHMLFPIILGRKALEGDFIVDVSKKYLLRK